MMPRDVGPEHAPSYQKEQYRPEGGISMPVQPGVWRHANAQSTFGVWTYACRA